MRITEGSNFESVMGAIDRTRGRMEKLQQQSATLKKLNAPSDDPVGSAKVLEMRTEKANHGQFQTTAKLANMYLENTDHALSDLSEIVLRAKEIALQQSSGASSGEASRLGVSEEVKQLFQQAVSTGNRRIADRYLFGGYKTTQPPVSAEGEYLGDNGEMMVEMAKDVFLAINLPGHQVFNTNPDASSDTKRVKELERKEEDKHDYRRPAMEGKPGVDGPQKQNVNLFVELQGLRTALLTGDIEAIHESLEKFDALHASVVAQRAKIGSRMRGLENTEMALDRHESTNAKLSASLEDADVAQTMSDLAKEETIFRGVLGSSKRLIQPTLMDFLR